MAEPMKGGTTVGDIKTPMQSANVGRKNTPSVQTYKDMPSSAGGGNIKGPGVKGSWKK